MRFPLEQEAVVLADRACRLSKVERANLSWADLSEIPQWSLQSYMNLSAYGLLSFPDNYARPNDALTRGKHGRFTVAMQKNDYKK